MKSIGDDAFYATSALSKVNYTGTLAQWCGIEFTNVSASPFYWRGDVALYIDGKLVSGEVVIPDGVTKIGAYAFYKNSYVTSVIIPSTVTQIGTSAFASSKVDKVVINNYSAATLDGSCFLASAYFYVPSSAVATFKSAWTDLADRIFPQTSLETVAVTTATDGHPALLNAIGGVGHEGEIVSLKVQGTINGYDIMLMRNKLTNLRYLDLSDATIVPEKDNYQYYTGFYTKENVLGAYSFYDVDNLRTVVLPKNITSVGAYAFANCNNLSEVTGMPECCTTIDDNAFDGNNGTALSRIDIGEGVTSIGSSAFRYCRSLREVSIPASVKTINYRAFIHCSNLETVHFAEGLESIGQEAFNNCSALKELRLPASLLKIYSSAFRYCSSLKEIHIPSMLTSIGDNAFADCTNALDVYSYTLTPINILQNSFMYDGVTLHAPQEPEAVFWDYYNNTQWSQFNNVVPFDAKYSNWYLGENQDVVLGDGETIPNEDGEQADGELNEGSGLEYGDGAYQWLDRLKLKWKGGKFPSLIDNPNVMIDELTFLLDVQANKWYFFCFPFDIDLDKAKFNGRFVWRYYDGDERASNGQGGWKNIGGSKLNAFQGYIFQTNKNGEIELTISNPIFTSNRKDVPVENHASENAQDAGWNFIGNPNLSYYDLTCFIENFKQPITVWDPVNNTYNAITPGDDDYTFHPFEAFFVQKSTDTDKMSFETENRQTANQAEETLNSRRRARAAMPIDENRRIVNLTITDGERTDKTRVVFNDEKAMGYETACDASKFLAAEGVPQIYTLDSNNVKYAINERPNADHSVMLGFVAPADGTYTISAARMDCAMAIKDSKTGTVHNFADGDYEFLAKAGTNETRFMLIAATDASGISSLQAAGIKLEVCEGGINIAGLNGNTAVVYNAAGSLMTSVSSDGYTSLVPGAYVVKVGELTSKVVVK